MAHGLRQPQTELPAAGFHLTQTRPLWTFGA